MIPLFVGAQCKPAVTKFCKNLNDMSILMNIDNTTVISVLNNKTSHKRFISNTVKRIKVFCMDRNVWIVASYLKSKDNIADADSRKFRANLGWSLCDNVYKNLINTFGVPEIDLFPSKINF